ncbi:MAG: PAS domain S-box protein [Deltaproteobacteria bacterium]|nr:PAS domain S-box protein [Deltaproteobacteria bacterium]
MSEALESPKSGLETLKQIVAGFHSSSLELTREYRRLEERVATLRDELERKNQQLENSLREREDARGFLSSILNSLKAGVLVLDQDLRPTFANQRLRKLMGEVDRERVSELVGEKLLSCFMQRESNFLPLDCEREVRDANGKVTPIHLAISKIMTGGQSSGYVLVFQDISRLKRLEAEAARSTRLAALGSMAAEVAHQIKSPLGGIELYASLLKERQQGDTKRLAEEILGAVRRLYTTLSRLLSFVAEPSICAESLPVSVLMREVKEICQPLLKDEKTKLTFHVQPRLPSLWGDCALLTQAIFNLIVNATEAMPHGGRIRIAARLSPFYSVNGRVYRTIEIIVRDQGMGIPIENREKIFDPFFTTKPNGTGLGLALAHKIIGVHMGSIEVSSQPGQGSSFTIFLPVDERPRLSSEEESYGEANTCRG